MIVTEFTKLKDKKITSDGMAVAGEIVADFVEIDPYLREKMDVLFEHLEQWYYRLEDLARYRLGADD